MIPTIDIEADNKLLVVVPAFVVQEDRFTDFDGASDLIKPRPDFGWSIGRFAQFDDGTNTAFNRNGHMFSPLSHINRAADLVVHTPLNMLHRRRDVIGTFVGTDITKVHKTTSDAAVDDSQLNFPYIEALSAIWKYHFAEEWALINKAHDQGACFLSMEAVAKSLTCFTPGCDCQGATYPYQGLQSSAYCDALNTPRSRKRLNYPHFVGGAMVVPPAMPGWRRADITKMGATATLADHPDDAELLFEQVAATAPHLDDKQAEFVMAMVLAGAFEPDFDRGELADADVERVFHCILSSNKIDDASVRASAHDAAEAEAAAGQLIAAGLAVVAKDSGRVLLIQRASDPADPAGGMWEFPGGHIDPGEDAVDAAKREWCEEVGHVLPDGEVVDTWTSPNGIYQGFVYLIDSEADVQINMDGEDRHVLNPDDPDGDQIETAAWWDPLHLPDMPALRAEVRDGTDWNCINNACGNDYDTLVDAEFGTEELAKLGADGKAFRNANGEWSYPTPTAEYVRKAMQAFGRSNPKDRPRLKAYLRKRAKAEGLSDDEIARIGDYSSS